MRAAVDVGGTFTDLVCLGPEGLTTLKVPSTPGEPEAAVLEALEAAGVARAELVHGSTVATNTLLERKGAKTAFITTRGFADIIEIGRQNRPRLYDLLVSRPPPLVPLKLRFEAAERVAAGGEVISRLTAAGARRVAAEVARSGAGAAAVCLLFSFERPEHEGLLKAELEKRGVATSLSSEVLPEYREYERSTTTVVNAYVSPVMEGYLHRLESALGSLGAGSLRLMHSAGGTVSPSLAVKRAAGLILSGPAGGAVATRELGSLIGEDRLIGFDMGGTSTDVSLLDGGFTITRETVIDGTPVALPMVDIKTIGAGGGSIARLDEAGVLKVGPESAGADPGPACYGRGTLATVTDACVVLGRLEPSWFLGGRMTLQPSRSRAALGSLAHGVGARRAAAAVVEVSQSHMERALKSVSMERGHDPRDFSLVAFGGAGPMHACELAGRFGMTRVVIPPYPGLFSSVGMLRAAPGRDYSRTVLLTLDARATRHLRAAFEGLEREAAAEMKREGFPRKDLEFGRSLSMRYRGQSHEVDVPLDRIDPGIILSAFEREYSRQFGAPRHGFEVEVVNVLLSCRAPLEDDGFHPRLPKRRGRPEPVGTRASYFPARVDCPLYDRAGLGHGQCVDGPALVLQADTTSVIPPGWTASVDTWGNLIAEVSR